MATFLTGKALHDKIYDIIWYAKDELFIVSPYIKLDDYFKELFEHHKHNHSLKIQIIFGKNEAQPGKSLRKEDLDFFKQFHNITIAYAADLHAKYYCNDRYGIITSINFYDKSFEKNIEFGVDYRFDIWDNLTNTVDMQAYNFCHDLLKASPAVLIRRPVYEKNLLSSPTFITSETLYDATDAIRFGFKWAKEPKRFAVDFPESKDHVNQDAPRPEKPVAAAGAKTAKTTTAPEKAGEGQGYCIRTGAVIAYNPASPLSYDAFRSWAQWENWEYPEKYCHRCGAEAPVTRAKPLCYNCYKATA